MTSSGLTFPPRPSASTELSFSSSISSFPLKSQFRPLKFSPISISIRAIAVSGDPSTPPQKILTLPTTPANSPQRLLKELAEHKKVTSPKKKIPPRRFILKPPLDDAKLTQRFLNSPQLSLKSFPLLSSCLPPSRLNNADRTWIDEYLLEAKQALGYPLEPSEKLGDDNPAKQFDTLLYLAFQHPFGEGERTKARHIRHGHSRLWFLGQYVIELAFAEFFLQKYPRESPGPMRERVYALTGKNVMPKWIKAASLQNLVFPYDEMEKMIRKEREPPVKSVFWALFGAIYLCFGMPEVYRILFEAFGMDPEDENCQPKLRRQLEDVDYVSVEFEGRQLGWQEVAAYKPPQDALFAHPRLFRACVPPGMHRFRGNIWDFDCRPKVMEVLGYPLQMTDRVPEITEARNIELGLGLQLCFLHPSKYKFEHPRFCFERLEYVGQKIQDLVMAERLLMKHLDAPGKWLQEKHRRLMMNKFCGRYLREMHLHRLIIYNEAVQDKYEHNRRLRNPTSTAGQQAIHGLSYCVYGKPDVRRLMFEVFDFEQILPKPV
ncbi:LOW QUALITY PROTEIN: ribonuclease III domain-containing protein RNC1, chloroplastic-like [Phalaenopsis equestris]|uniref:LOW QUALITY PROTEIN: ribonuclease III domain-containing protein RNC1, chloroplastic-like n=1 Tax=Phalaenopsis equestris TaxID=78828 RepID=UPI0009E2373F|nr:LOW QUALITY PROTEIN: ribonuclease III domain-containing protein RNC1, chloroplastic-like [Phalaenopsis equestris]